MQVDLRSDLLAHGNLTKDKMKPVSGLMASRLAWELGAVKYIECSAKTQQGLSDIFAEAVMIVVSPKVTVVAYNN